MTSKAIREAFLSFFEGKNHQVVASAPMVVKDDPTLMFTNAGMNQFKDLFLGNQAVKHPRVTDTQKCLRVSGKHNDLEEVGVDTYHHTMFEMLGNWSFGDYFKKDTIVWAWELLTEVYQLPKDRLYVTVFAGDEADGLSLDQEAYDHWKAIVDEDRIIKAGKKDNFWEMGDIGPCGPSSEIHIDLREEDERAKEDGKALVNQDHPQVVEIWNLVFMEYNRMASGKLVNLPAKHVDTGMGFERLCMALQGKKSNYDTDVFAPLIQKVEQLSGKNYQSSDDIEDVAIRVIVDHIRAIAFSIADGQLPSNTGAGYVIRRILRRAVRYGYSFLGFKSAFLFELVAVLVDQMGEQFPELSKQQALIKKVTLEEEQAFLRTLEKGIQRFEEYQQADSNRKVVDGSFAFELYDTFGFPIDLTELLAREKGIQVDMNGFQKALEVQKQRSRQATKIDAGDWTVLLEDEEVTFLGYDQLEAEVKISRYREVSEKGKTHVQLVFNQTPFYAEGGGQVGDTGCIAANGERTVIFDTKKENNLIIHRAKQLPSEPSAIFKAEVDTQKRAATAANHTATHLMHEALREVLGSHVEQKGSLVHPDYLRFDFSHFQKVSDEELATVERMVNDGIRKNLQLDEHRSMPIAEAKAMGAMALFGEKYGDTVRVIRFGSSVELCGGTHVMASGSIGSFRIVSEGAVAAGIRRIEAITAEKSDAFVQERLDLLEEIKAQLKNNQPLKAIQDLQEQNKKLSKQIEAQQKEQAKQLKADLLSQVETVNGINCITKRLGINAAMAKDIAFQLKAEVERLFLVLGSESEGKANLTVLISEDLAKEKSWNAGQLIREWAKEIQGGGGGQAFFASAGGKNPAGLDKAIAKAKELLSES